MLLIVRVNLVKTKNYKFDPSYILLANILSLKSLMGIFEISSPNLAFKQCVLLILLIKA